MGNDSVDLFIFAYFFPIIRFFLQTWGVCGCNLVYICSFFSIDNNNDRDGEGTFTSTLECK